MNKTIRSSIGLALGAGLLGALTGCAPYQERPPQRVAYYPEQPPPRQEYAPPPQRELLPPPPRREIQPPPPRAEYAPPPRRPDYAPPPPREGYAPPAPVRVESEVGLQDEYVYYPGYEIYYNSHRRQYTYREGNSWVSRPAPPRVAVDVLFASPSVRLDFHDAPEAHHQAIVRQYPKHWAPPGKPHDRNQGRGERD